MLARALVKSLRAFGYIGPAAQADPLVGPAAGQGQVLALATWRQ